MSVLRMLVGVLVLGAALLAGAGAPARADDGGVTIAWAPYVVVGATTVEIWNVADHATWPVVTVYLRTTAAGASCVAGVCTYRFQGPRTDAGRSWVFDPSDHACSLGLDATVCLPDWAEGSASFEPAIEIDADANAAVSTDPDGALIASVTAPTATYDAVAGTTAVTLTDVARRAANDGGGTTIIRVVGAASLRVDWYLDGELVAEQHASVGSDCCGETANVRAAPATIDPRDVEGLDDDAQYTVVITRISGADFAAVPSDSTDDR